MNRLSISLLAVSACVLIFTGCQKKQLSETEAQVNPQQVEANPENQGQSASDLEKIANDIASGKAYSCEMINAEAGQKSQYVAQGKKLRMTSKNISDEKILSEMLSDGEMIYTWDPATKKGMKFAVPSESEQKEMTEKAEGMMKNIPSDLENIKEMSNDGYQVNCTTTRISNSNFVVPTDVEFQDFSSMMDNVMNSIGKELSPEDQAKLFEQSKMAQ